MNKTIALKIFIDAIMLVLYLQLMFMYDNSPLYHEVAGIAVGLVCLLHLGLNGKTTKNLARRCSGARKPGAARLQMTLDVLLLVLMAATIITGLLIAQELFLGPCGLMVSYVHTTVSYGCLAVIAAHLLQHVPYLAGVLGKKKAKRARRNQPAMAYSQSRRDFLKGSVAISVGAFALISTGALALAKQNDTAFASTIQPEFSVQDTPQPEEQEAEVEAEAEAETEAETVVEQESVTEPAPTQEETNSSSSSSSSANASTNTVTYCTVCKKRCPISNLQCQRGVDWAQQNGYL